MSAKHTQGRLFFAYDDNGFYEIGSDANSLRIAFTYGEGETDESNARRLVVCWNACEGIPTARVEAGAVDILAYSMDIKAQRDELLDALEGLMYWDNGKPEWEVARAVIAKATN